MIISDEYTRKNMSSDEFRVASQANVCEIVKRIGWGTQSRAYLAIDHNGNEVCLKLTSYFKKQGEFHAQWVKSWGSRWFDMPILDTGAVQVERGRFIRWLIQPLGDDADFDDYYRLRDQIEKGGGLTHDMGCSQFITIRETDETFLTDYVCVIDPATDFNKKEKQLFDSYVLAYRGTTAMNDRIWLALNWCAKDHPEGSLLRAAIYKYHCMNSDIKS